MASVVTKYSAGSEIGQLILSKLPIKEQHT